jgi:hypothetical protein
VGCHEWGVWLHLFLAGSRGGVQGLGLVVLVLSSLEASAWWTMFAAAGAVVIVVLMLS